MTEQGTGSKTGRREPPAFRRVVVDRKVNLGPRLIRVTFTGSELEGFTVTEPAASVRLLLPSPGAVDLVIPTWNGNEFLLADGSRPIIRTFTPRRVDPRTPELDLDMVVHPAGIASGWATAAMPRAEAAISGPGRGYSIDPDAPEYLLAGDETSIPAISQLLERIPRELPIQVHVEVADESGVIPVPEHPAATVEWHVLGSGRPPGDAVVAALKRADLDPAVRVWCAGEAAAMHRIRTHLFKERGLPRSRATVRGYWKVDRKKS